MEVIQRVLVVLSLALSAAKLRLLARAVIQAMKGNPWFPMPDPPLATIATTADELEKAETLAKGRGVGTAAACNVKRGELVGAMRLVKAYVQKIADGNPAQATAIIQSAGMGIGKIATRIKNEFAAEHGATSGTANLVAKAVSGRAAYEWMFSTDQLTWVSLPITLQARTTVSGLTPGVVYWFRFRPVVKSGPKDWSQIVALLMK